MLPGFPTLARAHTPGVGSGREPASGGPKVLVSPARTLRDTQGVSKARGQGLRSLQEQHVDLHTSSSSGKSPSGTQDPNWKVKWSFYVLKDARDRWTQEQNRAMKDHSGHAEAFTASPPALPRRPLPPSVDVESDPERKVALS